MVWEQGWSLTNGSTVLLFACTANPHNNTSYQVMKASPAMGCFPCRLGSTVHTSLEQICITWGGERMIFPKLLFFRSQQTTACRLSIHLSSLVDIFHWKTRQLPHVGLIFPSDQPLASWTGRSAPQHLHTCNTQCHVHCRICSWWKCVSCLRWRCVCCSSSVL